MTVTMNQSTQSYHITYVSDVFQMALMYSTLKMSSNATTYISIYLCDTLRGFQQCEETIVRVQ